MIWCRMARSITVVRGNCGLLLEDWTSVEVAGGGRVLASDSVKVTVRRIGDEGTAAVARVVAAAAGVVRTRRRPWES